MAEKMTISVEEAAELLGVGRATAYGAIRRGEIPSIRIGRRLVVPLAAFQAMLAGGDGPTAGAA